MLNTFNKRNILLFLFFNSIFCNLIFAQKNQSYTGDYTLNNKLAGKANFQFIVQKGDTILDGDFKFDKIRKDTLEKDGVKLGHYYQGVYSKGLKEKEWIYKYRELKPTSASSIDNFNIVFQSEGKEHQIEAYFKNGKAERKWEAKTVNIENSQVTDTFFIAQANFNKNMFVEAFQAHSKVVKIIGNIDADGFFEGDWEFHHQSDSGGLIIEIRSFENGVLIEHFLEVDGKKVIIEHIGLTNEYSEEDQMWEELSMNKDISAILFETNFTISEHIDKEVIKDISEKSNLFLNQSLLTFSKHNSVDVWNISADQSQIQLPKLKVYKYPYSDKESKQIEEGLIKIENIKNVIKKFLDDPQVELNKHAYRELSLYFEIYTEYLDELVKIEKVFSLFSNPSYEYINRSEIMPYIFKGIAYPSLVKFEYQNKINEEEIDFPEDLSLEDANIQSLFKHIEQIESFIEESKTQVNPIIERNKKRFEIEDKEKQLVNHRDSVKKLFSNVEDDENFNELHKRYGKSVIDFTSELFKNYAKLPIEERIEKTDEVIACMDHFIDSYEQFIVMEEQFERVTEVYTRVVWNPFTFTDMEETVKERIYNAYKNNLVPFLLDDLENKLNCKQFESAMANFEKLYKKMRDLREQDTKEIERNLRRVRDPIEIIEILALDLVLD